MESRSSRSPKSPRTACPITDERLIESAAAGMLPLIVDGNLHLVVSPRATAARQILHLIQQNPRRTDYFRFTTAECLNDFVLRHAGETIAARGTGELRQRWPMLSAAPRPGQRGAKTLAFILPLALGATFVAPTAAMLTIEATLAVMFLGWLGLRLLGALIDWRGSNSQPRIPDDRLPVYTVIAALYYEANSVAGLLTAIEHLDYPRETRAAIAARATRLPLTVIPVPAHGPRTKPKALNTALPFARGAFTVIYDVEDRPEPRQLRQALQAFSTAATILLACRRGFASTIRLTAGWPGCSRRNMPDSSTCSCPGLPRSACRSLWAAHPIIFTQQHCANSAPGSL